MIAGTTLIACLTGVVTLILYLAPLR